MSNSNIAPFIKWAGGKRQLLAQIRERMPESFNNYYEPFVGGGAVIFDLLPTSAVINDINKALVNAYRQICNATDEFLKKLNELDETMWEDGKEYYYSLREHYNDKLMKEEFDVELAALFVFINKHCFNGLYRVNKKGLFNVPMGAYKNPMICDEKNLRAVSNKLQRVTIVCGDYRKSADFIDENTFVYFDPPYRPITDTARFTAYTENLFNDNCTPCQRWASGKPRWMWPLMR